MAELTYESLPWRERYYAYPENLMVLRCTCCSFMWDFPYTVRGIEAFENPLVDIDWEPEREGDDLCPKCGVQGEEVQWPS